MRRHYLQPLSPLVNPFIHRSFPNGKNARRRRWRRGAYPRGDTALSVPADVGNIGEGKEQDQCKPWQTCRNGSSKGRIIRTNQIVLLVIQIRLSYPFNDRVSRELQR